MFINTSIKKISISPQMVSANEKIIEIYILFVPQNIKFVFIEVS